MAGCARKGKRQKRKKRPEAAYQKTLLSFKKESKTKKTNASGPLGPWND
jgi:hypothetical protein